MKRLAVVSLIVAGLVTLLPGIASATNLGNAPDANGNYAVCNVDANVWTGTGGAVETDYRHSCNYGTTASGDPVQLKVCTTLEPCSGTAPSISGGHNGDTANTSPAACAFGQSGEPQKFETQTPSLKELTGLFCVASGSAGYSTITGCYVRYGGSEYRPCRYTTSTSGSMPAYPVDYYTGGTPGPTADVVGPAATCSDRLSAGNGTWAAFFTGGDSASATGATDTYSWAFGDTTTSSTQSPTHNYANAGPFTAVITVSRTPNTGHLFTDGTSTAKTSTCTLTVDFNAGNGTTTTTTTPTGDNGTGSGSCDLWDVGCWVIKGFRALFMPSSSTQAGMGQMWGDITTKAPFSVLYEVITYIPSELEHMAYATQHNQGDDEGPNGRPNYLVDDGCYSTVNSGVPNTGNPLNNTCNGLYGTGGAGTNQYALNYKGLGTGENTNATTLIRTIFLWVIGILFAYACYRGVGEILK